jgi:hypothetical protein
MCQKEWKNLRDRFNKENKTRSGAKEPASKWANYAVMLFNGKYSKHRTTCTSTQKSTIVKPDDKPGMGCHSLPSYKNYWSADEDFDTSIVRRTMSRNRFEMMLSNLHLNDNTTIPRDNKDKIYKLGPFVINMKTQFDLLHHGTRELAADESIILFKGRSSLKQYNPKKPIKRGYKLWCIADQHGLGERVVLSLTEKYWNQNRKIYFDKTTLQRLVY